ncbi:MAG: hypothetical protein IKQ97_00295 [Eubacterium sp.]|nr:hypothetical protein [Eubacterium sp.]
MSEDLKKEPIGEDELDTIAGGKGIIKDSSNGKKWACNFCTEVFATKAERDRHEKDYHKKSKTKVRL